MIAEILLPPSNILPHTYQDLSIIMKEIGMQYEAIHACLDDHVIFETGCLKIHISRYSIDQVTKNVSRKVIFYIHNIPRLQSLFKCKNITQFMDHAQNRSQDDIIRMPTYGSTFRDME